MDILLLADIGPIESNRLRKAIQATFSVKDTHPLPDSIPAPPSNWRREFTRMANEIGLAELTLNNAYQLIQEFLDTVLSNTEIGAWDQETQKWRWRAAQRLGYSPLAGDPFLNLAVFANLDP